MSKIQLKVQIRKPDGLKRIRALRRFKSLCDAMKDRTVEAVWIRMTQDQEYLFCRCHERLLECL